ncbi:hypothetical protein Syun_002078 [Stephania yunnanensis]|uniref:Uncharacterized protein n=1 Tax=Stephania yunnanensis TaxID=152371 RepID=A0AAP0LFZ8_9MAGN
MRAKWVQQLIQLFFDRSLLARVQTQFFFDRSLARVPEKDKSLEKLERFPKTKRRWISLSKNVNSILKHEWSARWQSFVPDLVSAAKTSYVEWGYDGAVSDVWSSDVIFYALLTSSLPFDDHNLEVLYQKLTWTPSQSRKVNESLVGLQIHHFVGTLSISTRSLEHVHFLTFKGRLLPCLHRARTNCHGNSSEIAT